MAAVAGALVAPATASWGALQEPSGIGIGLVDAPADRADDPRAHLYVIDHVQPGEVIERRVRVSNHLSREATVRLYGRAAEISESGFTVVDDRFVDEIADWITVRPSTMTLAPESSAVATVTIAVPDDAVRGEHYGAILAELPAPEGPGIAVRSRVGVRAYLSVGPGGEPPTDFEVRSLTAQRGSDGTPSVRVTVENTGQRAIDLSGRLWLSDGPAGLSAGPFPTRGTTTLGIGMSGEMSVPLDPELPPGPWNARVVARSGPYEREAEATIVFPEAAGGTSDAVEAEPVDVLRRWLVPLATALLLLTLVALILFSIWWKRRRDEEEEEEHRRAAIGGNGQRSAERQRDEAGVGER